MPHSHAILLPRTVTAEDISNLIEPFGGEWLAFGSQGFIGDKEVWLFIRGLDVQEEDLNVYTAEELSEAERASGQPMVAALTLDHSEDQRGAYLARRVIDDMIARWRAYHIDEGESGRETLGRSWMR